MKVNQQFGILASTFRQAIVRQLPHVRMRALELAKFAKERSKNAAIRRLNHD
jgi:hypothetical protein